MTGSLSKRVSIQQADRASDGAGGSMVPWSDVATVWASIEPVNGHESYIAQALHGKISHKMRMRYRTGIAPSMRALYGSRTFNILAALNDNEKGRYLLLFCEESI